MSTATCCSRGTERVPISPSLLARVGTLAIARGTVRGTDKVFRSTRGRPISRKRYCTLFGNVQDS